MIECSESFASEKINEHFCVDRSPSIRFESITSQQFHFSSFDEGNKTLKDVATSLHRNQFDWSSVRMECTLRWAGCSYFSTQLGTMWCLWGMRNRIERKNTSHSSYPMNNPSLMLDGPIEQKTNDKYSLFHWMPLLFLGWMLMPLERLNCEWCGCDASHESNVVFADEDDSVWIVSRASYEFCWQYFYFSQFNQFINHGQQLYYTQLHKLIMRSGSWRKKCLLVVAHKANHSAPKLIPFFLRLSFFISSCLLFYRQSTEIRENERIINENGFRHRLRIILFPRNQGHSISSLSYSCVFKLKTDKHFVTLYSTRKGRAYFLETSAAWEVCADAQ